VLIGYLVGTDADEGMEDAATGVVTTGCTDFYKLRTRDPTGYARLHVPPDYFRQPVRYRLDRFDMLVNLVTDPDQNPKVLANLVRLVSQYRGRIVNPPHKVLRSTRDKVARACRALPHVVAPQAIRIANAKLRSARKTAADFPLPAILRLAGTHTGRVLGVIEDADALVAALVPGEDHYLTEYKDFRSDDGLYRKYRFAMIGGEPVMRHMLVSDDWNVHAADRDRFMAERPALVREEREAIDYGMQAFPHPVREGLAGIARAVGLDFFGVDCAIGPDGVILFEANATMNFFPLSPDPRFAYLQKALARAERAFDVLLFGHSGDRVR
jgi:hypothetical protein